MHDRFERCECHHIHRDRSRAKNRSCHVSSHSKKHRPTNSIHYSIQHAAQNAASQKLARATAQEPRRPSLTRIFKGTTHRINVGANPRQNTPIPSFLYEWTIVDHVERYGFTSLILPSSSPLAPFRWRPALRRRGVPSNRRDVCVVPFAAIRPAEPEGASIRGPGPNVGACVDIGTYTGWLPCTRVFTTSKGKVTTQPAIHEEGAGGKGQKIKQSLSQHVEGINKPRNLPTPATPPANRSAGHERLVT
jgi:hypothetical protein